jgi:hypothetical protein
MPRHNHAGRRILLVAKKMLLPLSCVGCGGACGLSLCVVKKTGRGKRVDTHSQEVYEIQIWAGSRREDFTFLCPHACHQALTQDTHLPNHKQISRKGCSIVSLVWRTPASWNGPR